MKTEKLFEQFLITCKRSVGNWKNDIYKRRIENAKKLLKNVIHTYILYNLH
jgi:hypothetical protein